MARTVTNGQPRRVGRLNNIDDRFHETAVPPVIGGRRIPPSRVQTCMEIVSKKLIPMLNMEMV
jgi:hypothetical protein